MNFPVLITQALYLLVFLIIAFAVIKIVKNIIKTFKK